MKLVYETQLGKLYLGDAGDGSAVIDEDCLDLVITDPPYPRKFMYCYELLAWLYPDLMKVGASLFTIVGHYALSEVMDIFMGEAKLKYRWVFCLDQSTDRHARMAMGIEVMWKPMLWYVKDHFPRERHYGFMKDMIKINSKEKDLHEWQQSVTWCYDIIQKLTKENELVCDPFMGSGTVAIACENLHRRWVGIDNDPRAIDITIERLRKHENSRIV